jgi:hypothetical protein
VGVKPVDGVAHKYMRGARILRSARRGPGMHLFIHLTRPADLVSYAPPRGMKRAQPWRRPVNCRGRLFGPCTPVNPRQGRTWAQELGGKSRGASALPGMITPSGPDAAQRAISPGNNRDLNGEWSSASECSLKCSPNGSLVGRSDRSAIEAGRSARRASRTRCVTAGPLFCAAPGHRRGRIRRSRAGETRSAVPTLGRGAPAQRVDEPAPIVDLWGKPCDLPDGSAWGRGLRGRPARLDFQGCPVQSPGFT